jgi:6-phosphogluconolactonase (cycloisomerase 2 family)
VTLDPSAGFLLVADMGADRIFIHRYDAARRALVDAPDLHIAVPAGAGPRLLLFGKDGCFAYLLTELSAEIYVYGWDAATGRLTSQGVVGLDPSDALGDTSAAGFTQSADGRFLYATNRRTGAIHVFSIDEANGQLTPVQTIDAGGQALGRRDHADRPLAAGGQSGIKPCAPVRGGSRQRTALRHLRRAGGRCSHKLRFRQRLTAPRSTAAATIDHSFP